MGSKYKGLYSVNDMFRLYPVTLPLEATGGVIEDIVVGNIVYRLHKFVDTGSDVFNVTFVPGAGALMDMLVIAGGGSGGQGNTTNANGGGGAGGVLYKSGIPISLGSIAVEVGAGGAARGDNEAAAGINGGNSFFGDYIAIGGGGGGGRRVAPLEGGSSGGMSLYASGPVTTSLQTDVLGATGYGNIGGQTIVNYTGAGGGGAGSVGEAGAAASPGGDGGQGVSFDIEGETKWYAGGGGGSGNSTNRAGDGYHGGGRGAGTTSEYGASTYPDEVNETTLGSGTPHAIPNTGGGGGAGTYWSSAFPTSGAGGSGIVIIRYPIGTV